MALDVPVSSNDLYLARGEEIGVFRPFMQGDIFQGIVIPGVDGVDRGIQEDLLAMVVTHPCSMRRGAQLVSHVHAVRVRRHNQPIPFKKWSSHHFRLMPLPELLQDQADQTYAAHFEELGRISTDELKLERRIACLSDERIVLLQQRFVHYLTRVVVPKAKLFEHIQHVLEEAELQEEWCRRLLQDLGEEEIKTRLADEIQAFDHFLGQAIDPEDSISPSLRQGLRIPENRAGVRRAVNDEIKRRSSGMHRPPGINDL